MSLHTFCKYSFFPNKIKHSTTKSLRQTPQPKPLPSRSKVLQVFTLQLRHQLPLRQNLHLTSSVLSQVYRPDPVRSDKVCQKNEVAYTKKLSRDLTHSYWPSASYQLILIKKKHFVSTLPKATMQLSKHAL